MGGFSGRSLRPLRTAPYSLFDCFNIWFGSYLFIVVEVSVVIFKCFVCLGVLGEKFAAVEVSLVAFLFSCFQY